MNFKIFLQTKKIYSHEISIKPNNKFLKQLILIVLTFRFFFIKNYSLLLNAYQVQTVFERQKNLVAAATVVVVDFLIDHFYLVNNLNLIKSGIKKFFWLAQLDENREFEKLLNSF